MESEVPKAVMCVVVHDQRFLLIKRGSATRMPGFWCHVSGRLEPGETLMQAAERELFEEVGLRAQAMNQLTVTLTEGGEYELYWIYLASNKDQEVVCSDEVSSVAWVTLDEYQQLSPRFESNLVTLRQLVSEGKIPNMVMSTLNDGG